RPQHDAQIADLSLAERTRSVQRSPIRKMFDLAQQRAGENLVHLEIGEPDFDTPAHVPAAATEAAASGATHYTSNAGLPELRAAVADDLGPGHTYDPDDQILITAGAMEALALAYLTLVDSGGEVLVPSPAWPNYRTHATMV